MEKFIERTTNMIKRIAITGPESTGKSILARQLADHYKTVWVPEFAREYIGNLNRPYFAEDILIIAKEQLQRENLLAQNANKFLFCDTELIVTKIWIEHAFKSCPEWIVENLIKHKYDLYLLTNIDIPWEKDPQREHPHLREYFFGLYLKNLKSRTLPFNIISGLKEERLMNSIRIIDKMFGET